MSQFSRRAAWLNTLFPQSVAPAVRDPGQRSDDVSLVQPYDGGAYALAVPVNPTVASAPLANTTFTIHTVPDDEVHKMVAVSANFTAGISPTRSEAVIDHSGLEQEFVNRLTVLLNPQFTVFSIPSAGSYGAVILPPGTRLRIRYSGGNGATVVTGQAFLWTAPVGAVFYC